MVVRKNKRYTFVGSLQFGQGIPQGARERLTGSEGVLAMLWRFGTVVTSPELFVKAKIKVSD